LIKVTQEVDVYEVDKKKADTSMLVNSYPSKEVDFIVLIVGGHSYTVRGWDLEAAIDNAMNKGDK